MASICGMDCCKECSRKEECGGCQKVKGHPFGKGTCIAAECIKRGGIEEFFHFKNPPFSFYLNFKFTRLILLNFRSYSFNC